MLSLKCQWHLNIGIIHIFIISTAFDKNFSKCNFNFTRHLWCLSITINNINIFGLSIFILYVYTKITFPTINLSQLCASFSAKFWVAFPIFEYARQIFASHSNHNFKTHPTMYTDIDLIYLAALEIKMHVLPISNRCRPLPTPLALSLSEHRGCLMIHVTSVCALRDISYNPAKRSDNPRPYSVRSAIFFSKFICPWK